jgi:hypothetical protein
MVDSITAETWQMNCARGLRKLVSHSTSRHRRGTGLGMLLPRTNILTLTRSEIKVTSAVSVAHTDNAMFARAKSHSGLNSPDQWNAKERSNTCSVIVSIINCRQCFIAARSVWVTVIAVVSGPLPLSTPGTRLYAFLSATPPIPPVPLAFTCNGRRTHRFVPTTVCLINVGDRPALRPNDAQCVDMRFAAWEYHHVAPKQMCY